MSPNGPVTGPVAIAGPILVAGGGIAGLTAALAFARHGFSVAVFERAPVLESAGAGLQLSPNATRILIDLGLGAALRAAAVRPEAVVLADARTLGERARVPLGAWGEKRWGAPYLVLRRADLQRALLDAVVLSRGITLLTGASVIGASSAGAALAFKEGSGMREVPGTLAVGADGVRSVMREALAPGSRAQATGLTAWRRTLTSAEAAAPGWAAILHAQHVTAFLHPRSHLVAYPMQGGAFNLVAFAPDEGAGGFDIARAFAGAALPLKAQMTSGAGWSPWPLSVAPALPAWTYPAPAALIGDAAHAMAPFAAQGAGMAIEDAATLAAAVAAGGPGALAHWESGRRERIARVQRRGRLNRMAWHASGPVALARNLALKLRSPEGLAADLDWLYGWKEEPGE